MKARQYEPLKVRLVRFPIFGVRGAWQWHFCDCHPLDVQLN